MHFSKKVVFFLLFEFLISSSLYAEVIRYNGGMYEGEIVDNLPHGQGTYTRTDGFKYIGEWKHGEMHGSGVLTFSDGAEYVGELKNDALHGTGKITLFNGSFFAGEWQFDKPWNGNGFSAAGGVSFVFSNGIVSENK